MPRGKPIIHPAPVVRIDAYHHFWCYSAAAPGWIVDAMPAVPRDLLRPGLAVARIFSKRSSGDGEAIGGGTAATICRPTA